MPERETAADLSHREVVEHLAQRARRIARAIETVKLVTPGKPPEVELAWDQLDPRDREDARQFVYSVLRHPEGSLAEVWADRCDKLEGDGWSRAFVHNDAAKESPLLRPFDELPLVDRQALAVFITSVRAMYE